MFEEYKHILTNPLTHDVRSYCYIVKALPTPDDFSTRFSHVNNQGQYFCASLIGAGSDSGQIYNRDCLFGDIGVILDFSSVPDDADLIKIAYHYDLNSPRGRDNVVRFIGDNSDKLCSPIELLCSKYGLDNFSHLIIEGHPMIELAGVIYRDSSVEKDALSLMDSLVNLGCSDLPLINIKIPDSNVDDYGGSNICF